MKKLLYILLFAPIALFGQQNYSLCFDGVDDKILIQSQSNDFNLTNVSILAKISWGGPNGSEYSNIVDKLPGIDAGYGLQIYNYSGKVGWEFANGTNYVSCNGGQLVENEWTSIASTYDGDVLKLYINGVLVNEILYSFQLISNDSPLSIGHRHTSVDEYFKGQIDEVSIFDKALTQDEIHQYTNCNLSGNEEGLVGYWNFNDGYGNTVNDISGNGNHGIIHGATFSDDVPEQNCDYNNSSAEYNTLLSLLQNSFSTELLSNISHESQLLSYENSASGNISFNLTQGEYYILSIDGSASLCFNSGNCNHDALYAWSQQSSNNYLYIDTLTYEYLGPVYSGYESYYLKYSVPNNFHVLNSVYNEFHEYWFLIKGTSSEIGFSFLDEPNAESDNYGGLNFSLYEIPQSLIHNMLYYGCVDPDAMYFGSLFQFLLEYYLHHIHNNPIQNNPQLIL